MMGGNREKRLSSNQAFQAKRAACAKALEGLKESWMGKLRT